MPDALSRLPADPEEPPSMPILDSFQGYEFQGSFKQDIKDELKSFVGELGTILMHRDAPSDASVSGSTFRYSSNSIGSILYRRFILFPNNLLRPTKQITQRKFVICNYGTSTENVRIESWWRQGINSSAT
jgi:hypothetical protein